MTDDILSVNTQPDHHRLRVGRWTIHSQSLDGQQLQSSDWILPKHQPPAPLSPARLTQRSPKAHVLNAHLLENPGGGSSQIQARSGGRPGTLGQPSFAELWLPGPAGSGESDSQDSK